MNTPEERPKRDNPILDLPDMNEVADKLFEEGKISNMQAAQLKMWFSAMPDINAGSAKFEAWKKARPDIDVPGLFTPGEKSKPILDLPSLSEMAEKMAKDGVKPVLDMPDMNEVADKLSEQGKISNMQAAQIKMWYSVKPDKSAGLAKFEAWKKAHPAIDIPGLFPE